MFQERKEGICFKIKVIPKASKTEIVGWENGELKIRLSALPEKGKANQELLRYLASILGIGKSKVHLVKGETGRNKQVCIEGLTLKEIEHVIGANYEKD